MKNVQSEDVAVGNWVSFFQDGAIKYSQIKYIRQGVGVGKTSYFTDSGSINLEQILEVRGIVQKDPVQEDFNNYKVTIARLEKELEKEKAAKENLAAILEEIRTGL